MKVEVSIGEAIDKFSILELKNNKISDEYKKKEIQKEIQALNECIVYKKKYNLYYSLLFYINEKIWDMTDNIKSISIDDSNFSQISNEIFELNQKRFRIKNWFNLITNSNIKEQKSYPLSTTLILINNINTFNDKFCELIYLSLEYDKILIMSQFNDKIQNIIGIPTISYIENNQELDIFYYNKTINLDEYFIDFNIKNIFYTFL